MEDDNIRLRERSWCEYEISERGGCIGFIIYAIIILCLVLMCAGCQTKNKIEYRDNVVDHYITNVVHDTLRENTSDSVYHEVVVRNDTVYNTKYKEKIKYRDRVVERHDTCWRDSVVTEYKETTKEVRYIPKVYKWAMGIAILAILFVAFKIYRKLKGKIGWIS